ncbi:tRNA (guanosine(37)-N1)-methyltransferase TrmD [Candidatus Curtissbacteria bacterium]|nr:tRNA (guanosine(37)-N1)-methyltransferase TrmD [Candidatus Curtissbacteria bacterium]
MSKKFKAKVFSHRFYILSLFPEMFEGTFSQSIIKHALDKKLISIKFVNPRDFAQDLRKTVDDKPYGGGSGMVMKVDVLTKALESIRPKPYSILLSASGRKYTQEKAQYLAKKKEIALICGHYEGVDARLEYFVDEITSIGDFVLTGGEIPAMAIVDSVTRLLPGVIKKESTDIESFSPSTINPLRSRLSSRRAHLARRESRRARSEANHQPSTLLEYPQYTRPEEFRGFPVPKVLLSGNHKQIENWREEQILMRTKKFRPDLLKSK